MSRIRRLGGGLSVWVRKETHVVEAQGQHDVKHGQPWNFDRRSDDELIIDKGASGSREIKACGYIKKLYE